MSPRTSLQAHGLEFLESESVEGLAGCPKELKALFEVVIRIHEISFKRFGGRQVLHGERQQIGASMTPQQQYEKELKNEAINLEVISSDKRRADDIEEAWVEKVKPVVFHRFSREDEETFSRNRHHHCFICRKNFPAESRPSISAKSREIVRRRALEEKDKQKDLCRTQNHYSLPHFDMVKLTYPGSEDESRKTPDVTIGLHSSDPTSWHGVRDARIIENDWVQMFSPRVLDELESNGYLVPPFVGKGGVGKKTTRESRRRIGDISLTFPFGVWEAKRLAGGYDHQSAQEQNSLKVKGILDWQQQVGNKADVPWQPLVWHFVNVGSDWKVHACHFQENPMRTGYIQVQRQLWSGNTANRNSALQLLYLMDIIALWGQYEYKPFAGACIQRLEALLDEEERPRLKETLFQFRREINARSFPWLSQEMPRSRCTSVSSFGSIRQPSRSLTGNLSQGSQYIIPECTGFIWLLDRDPLRQDILIIRVDSEGYMLPPLVVFGSAKWDDDGFVHILKAEKARRSKRVAVEFRESRRGKSYLETCINRKSGYFELSDTQFCAIIPLDPQLYRCQRRKHQGYASEFEQFETILGLPKLLDDADDANKRWCTCRAKYTLATSSVMKLCENVHCRIGWYHIKCARRDCRDEDFDVSPWICRQCRDGARKVEVAECDIAEVSQDIRNESEVRIQRTRTLFRVWEQHEWPEAPKVCQAIERISCQIYMDKETDYNTVRDIDSLDRKGSRSWAILRDRPKVMHAVGPLHGTSVSSERLAAPTADGVDLRKLPAPSARSKVYYC